MVHETLEWATKTHMMRNVLSDEWGPFLERFGREHVAWLATVHIVGGRGTAQRSAEIAMKSASGSDAGVTLEFLGDAPSLHVDRPSAVRTQQTDDGLIQALEIETATDEFVRLAFRATARPEQLDGLAPGELSIDPSPAADS
jgi:hypothetical protein